MPKCTTTQKTLTKLEFLTTFFFTYIIYNIYNTTQIIQSAIPSKYLHVGTVGDLYWVYYLINLAWLINLIHSYWVYYLINLAWLINLIHSVRPQPKMRRTLCQCEEIACLPFLHPIAVRFIPTCSRALYNCPFYLESAHIGSVFPAIYFTLFVLRFYGPVNPVGSCRARSVYLTTRLLGRLSPLSG